jgi:hypothetical protein
MTDYDWLMARDPDSMRVHSQKVSSSCVRSILSSLILR